MSQPPPIPEAQRGRGPESPDLSQDRQGRRERRSGVAEQDFNPGQQGQSANTRQTDGRQGRTQDR